MLVQRADKFSGHLASVPGKDDRDLTSCVSWDVTFNLAKMSSQSWVSVVRIIDPGRVARTYKELLQISTKMTDNPVGK